jgi:hypothetical protein
VALSRSRQWLGPGPNGQPWLPPYETARAYRLQPGYLWDWDLFLRLQNRRHNQADRSVARIADLRAALQLVRGVPLDRADRPYSVRMREPYPWLPCSTINRTHLIATIVDTAHELADLYLQANDTGNARWAVQQAWTADPDRSYDETWHDLIRAEHLDGHTARLRELVTELLHTRHAEVPEDLPPATYRLLHTLIPDQLDN